MTTQELIEDVRLQLKPLEVSTFDVRTAEIAVDEMGMGRSVVTSILLLDAVRTGARSVDEIQNEYGEDVGHILSGLKKINDLYAKNPVIANFFLQLGVVDEVGKGTMTLFKYVPLISSGQSITTEELAEACGLTSDGVFYQIKKLKQQGILIREGGRKEGQWHVNLSAENVK